MTCTCCHVEWLVSFQHTSSNPGKDLLHFSMMHYTLISFPAPSPPPMCTHIHNQYLAMKKKTSTSWIQEPFHMVFWFDRSRQRETASFLCGENNLQVYTSQKHAWKEKGFLSFFAHTLAHINMHESHGARRQIRFFLSNHLGWFSHPEKFVSMQAVANGAALEEKSTKQGESLIMFE